MFYKPDYCNGCGQQIERTSRKFWKNTRFCDVCEQDFRGQEWIPRAFMLLCFVFGLFGLGSFFSKDEKPLNLASRQFTETSADSRKNLKKVENTLANVPESVITNAANIKKAEENRGQNSLNAARPTLTRQAKVETQTSEEESTYYCGAETKKGTPCSRKVKGGGRCWQHKGQAAILPPEKLIAIK
ncbi:MAG: hypothetical protein LUM44_02575 [Pyrinomonadaceae bacterium]|nr:hypothetical protein [Pyrinomonadaceae bacterium]